MGVGPVINLDLKVNSGYCILTIKRQPGEGYLEYSNYIGTYSNCMSTTDKTN